LGRHDGNGSRSGDGQCRSVTLRLECCGSWCGWARQRRANRWRSWRKRKCSGRCGLRPSANGTCSSDFNSAKRWHMARRRIGWQDSRCAGDTSEQSRAAGRNIVPSFAASARNFFGEVGSQSRRIGSCSALTRASRRSMRRILFLRTQRAIPADLFAICARASFRLI